MNLDAKKGVTIALVGDSGGGRSSLINLIVRFYDTTNVEILINNNPIKYLDLKS
ncbi:ATP-binding cassette domain-containing protein [Aliarcobacter butzleri]|uniref:ATP-binding cassette domain-containing protein n=1 Tax=Aliarcobacter butzleri TaxID=28197 RepID=UPI003AEB2F94